MTSAGKPSSSNYVALGEASGSRNVTESYQEFYTAYAKLIFMKRNKLVSVMHSNKKSQTYDLKSKWYLGVIVSVLTIALVYIIRLKLVSNNTDCDDIMCGLAEAITLYFVGFIFAVLSSTFVAIKLITSNRLIALLSVLPTVILGDAFVDQQSKIKYLFFGSYNSLSTTEQLVFGFIVLVVFVVMFSLQLYVLRALLNFHMSFAILLVVLLGFLYTSYIPQLIKKAESRTNKERLEEATINLSFDLYQPKQDSYGKPTNVYAYNINASPNEQGPYLWLDYTINDQLGSFTIKQFTVPAKYNPPVDCTDPTPEKKPDEHITKSCRLLTSSSTGCDVFFRGTTYGGSYYCLLGKTLITLEAWNSYKLGESEVVKIYNSLVPTNASSLLKD